MRQVLAIFERQAGREFLIEAATERRFTYEEFYGLACGAAAALAERGVSRDDRVALVLHNSAEFAALYFGCLFLGAVAVPVNPGLHPEEIKFILKDAGVKLTVHGSSAGELVEASAPALHLVTPGGPEGGVGQVTFAAAPPPASVERRFAEGAGGEELFSITFTSGTTSRPKGVAHYADRLLRNAAEFNDELDFGPDRRFLHVMPMAYMAGFLNTLLGPFMAGAAVVLASPFDAQSALRFWRPVVKYEADTFWLAPTMLAALLRIDRDRAGADYCRARVRTICVGTAPLPLKVKEEFEARYGVELFESYGLSELLLLTANSARAPRVQGSVGRAMPSVEVKAADEGGRHLGIDEDGEILIRTPYVMAGYLDYETSEPSPVGVEDWFATGDIGHVSAAGDVFITARKKDLIIRGGVNVSPRAVEEVLLRHPAVAQVAVVGLPHEFYGEEVVAAVGFKPGHGLASEQSSLQVLCRASLSAASTPTRYVEVDEFPASANGKIQKNKLRELILSGRAAVG